MKYTLDLKNLPFEPLRTQIIYVENGYDEVVNKFIQDNYEKICDYCSQRNYEFCYLPKLTAQPIDEEVLFYNAPYAKPQEAPKPVGSDFLLEFLAQPKNRELIPPSLLYLGMYGRITSAGGLVTFKAMSVTDQDVYPHVEDIFYWRLQDIFSEKYDEEEQHENVDVWYSRNDAPRFSREKCKDDGPKFSKEIDNSDNDEGILFRMPYDDAPELSKEPSEVTRKIKEYFKDIKNCLCEPDESQNYNQTADSKFDEESKKIADEIKQRIETLEKKGIGWVVLEKYLKGKKLSRLHITKEFRIFLPDYNNMEITMTPLPKALFLLFLCHPEGIPFKYLPDYKKEVFEIYTKLKPNADPAVSYKSIEDLTDPFGNSINEKCARVREAFVSQFEEHLAENYFITGKRGEPKLIKLPRELVIWE